MSSPRGQQRHILMPRRQCRPLGFGQQYAELVAFRVGDRLVLLIGYGWRFYDFDSTRPSGLGPPVSASHAVCHAESPG